MFENPDFQVDEQSEEFRLLNPIVSKVGQKRKKKLRLQAQQEAAVQQVRAAMAAMLTSEFILRNLRRPRAVLSL